MTTEYVPLMTLFVRQLTAALSAKQSADLIEALMKRSRLLEVETERLKQKGRRKKKFDPTTAVPPWALPRA